MTSESDPVQAATDAGKTREYLLEELRQLQTQLARSERDVATGTPPRGAEDGALLKRIIDAVSVFAFAVDANGVITFGSGRGLEHLSAKSADMVGKALRDVFGGPAADQALSRSLGGESVSCPIETGNRAFDLWLVPLRDAQGHVSSVAGIATDATRRNQDERELRDGQRLMEQMLCLHERDRQLIAYEVHDGLVQDATGALMHLEALLQTGQLFSEVRDRVRQAADLVRKSVHEARELIRGLRPPILDELGVVPAIEYLIEETVAAGSAIELTTDVQFDRLEPLLETTIYRVVQEALTNANRHSHSDRVEVRLTQADERIHVEIQDWGVGFDPGSVAENRFGLQGIRERVRLMRGRAMIDSAPGKGTRVFVDLPVAGALHEVASAQSWSIE